jgi:multiple sugar transport system substrate-binding protein
VTAFGRCRFKNFWKSELAWSVTMRTKVLILLVLLLLAMSFSTASAQTVLRVWTGSSGPAEDEFKQAQFDAFEAAHPDIDLEVLISGEYGTQIQAAFAAGDYPEVFTVGQFDFPSLVDSDLLMPAGDRIVEQDDVFPNLLAAFSDADGNPYCVPKDYSTLAVYYNTDYFDAAGLEYPTVDWTWDDMYAAAEAITNADITTADGLEVVGMSVAADRNRWLGFFSANGASLFDVDGNVVWDSPEGVAALEYYNSYVANGVGDLYGNLGGAGWNGEAFGRGFAGMTVEGNWAIGALETDFPDLNWGVAEVPTAPSGEKGTLTFTECWAVSSAVEGTELQDAAWELVNFLTGPEGAMAVATSGFGVLPARASASQAWLDTRGEEFAAFVNGAAYAWAPVFPLGYGDFTTAVDEGTVAVLNGEATVADAMTEMADVAREIHDEMAQ